jgi:hypothetical protein
MTIVELRRLGLTVHRGHWRTMKTDGQQIAGAGFGDDVVAVTVPKGSTVTQAQLQAARRYVEQYLTGAIRRG